MSMYALFINNIFYFIFENSHTNPPFKCNIYISNIIIEKAQKEKKMKNNNKKQY